MTTTNNEPLGGEKCQRCDGTGVQSYHDHGAAQFGEAAIEPIKCSDCNGFGRPQAGAAGASEISPFAHVMATINACGSDAARCFYNGVPEAYVRELVGWVLGFAATANTGAAGAGEVKTWQERATFLPPMHKPSTPVEEAMASEIADLRAQLARLQAPASESIDTPEFRSLIEDVILSGWRGDIVGRFFARIYQWRDTQLARQRHTVEIDGRTYAADELKARIQSLDAEAKAVWSQHEAGAEKLEELEARQRQGGYLGWFLECTNGRGEKIFAAVNEGMPHAVQLYTTPAAQAQGEPVAYMLPSDIKSLPDGGYTTAFYDDVTNTTTGERSVPVYLGSAAQADEVRDAALEEAAILCETKEIPFDVSVWLNTTKQGMSGKTALALAELIRALKRTTAADNQKCGA